MANGDERDEFTEPGPEGQGAGPNDPKGRRGAEGDDWEDWDEEEWDRDGSSKPLDIRVIAVIAAAIIIVISVIWLTRDDDGGETAGGEGNGQEVGPCGTGNWEWGFGGSTEGVEKRMTEGEVGVFVWNDFQGVHVRSNLDSPVTVKLTGDDVFDVKTTGDGVTASADAGREVTFELPAGDGAVGPDIDIKCLRSMTIDVRAGEEAIPTEQLLFGDDTVAAANPFTFRRPE